MHESPLLSREGLCELTNAINYLYWSEPMAMRNFLTNNSINGA
jgi:hypothetical protein